MASPNEPVIHTLYESGTGTWQYIVADPETKRAAIVDPVLDFDAAKNETSTTSADKILDVIETEGYHVEALLETHMHADHITAAGYLRDKLMSKQGVAPTTSIGRGVEGMQKVFGEKYNVPTEEWTSAFDRTWADGDIFSIGNLQVAVLHLPGHTPDHIGYQIGSNVFTGDSIFNPDLGSARCDFPEGSAAALWKSMQRLLALPPSFRLYTGHDYPPADRATAEGNGKPRPYATVEEHRAANKHVKDGTGESSFVDMRTTRDAGLQQPKLMNQALQFNIRAGQMPRASAGGDRMVHIPLKLPSGLAAVV